MNTLLARRSGLTGYRPRPLSRTEQCIQDRWAEENYVGAVKLTEHWLRTLAAKTTLEGDRLEEMILEMQRKLHDLRERKHSPFAVIEEMHAFAEEKGFKL